VAPLLKRVRADRPTSAIQNEVNDNDVEEYVSGRARRGTVFRYQSEGRPPMNLRPLHDRIIVERFEESEQRSGGIIIPDSAREKPQQGKVLAAGLGKSNEDGKRVPLDVKAGDIILFGKYSGQEIKVEGIEYLIMKEEDVLAITDTKKTGSK
jgi:chaperonin GroES